MDGDRAGAGEASVSRLNDQIQLNKSVNVTASRRRPDHAIRQATREEVRGVNLVLLEGTDTDVMAWVRDRVADVGFAGADSTDGTNLITVSTVEDELLLLVPRTHRLARTGRVRVGDIRGERWLLSAGRCEPLVRRVLMRAKIDPRIAMMVRDMNTLLALVREGLGLTLIPALALPRNLGGLRALGLDTVVYRTVVAVTGDPSEAPPALSAFLALSRMERS
jgi:DNA-binding transcriptional LysR family regulator